ncbi:uncharacterized protein LOC114722351 [Neltuma alba]|uniref:uncharacterized protein LOC114722351 n=1 Tax=Neltuma alba TaxID=207710 RepID=UPI0010A3EDA3|nr:uncharacterized protein LOC114722351 [Prosopis alba]XP_028764194.1 uncharacterized protein LOC114722351 [Prosopis alba]
MEPEQLNSKHCGDLLKHLDRQNEFLMESYRLMVHELQKLQVEEEMLMHKLYEVMSAQGITKKNKDSSHDSNNSDAERSYESH